MYKILSLNEVAKELNPDKFTMFDTETNIDQGFYSTVELAQFYQKGWDEALLVRKPDVLTLAAILASQKVVGHYIHYDITTIQANLGITWIPEHFHCTFLLSRLYFYDKDSFKLNQCIHYLNDESLSYGDITKKELQTSDWSKELDREQLEYASLDVILLQKLWEVVNGFVDDNSYMIDLATLKHCLNFQNNGMPLQKDRLLERLDLNNKLIEELDIPINVNSHKQVKEYLEASGSCNDIALAKMIYGGSKKAFKVRTTRKTIKENSFINKFLTTAKDGCIYGKFNPSARSGRLTCKDQNLQQTPRSLKIAFGIPENDEEILLYSDYSQLEMRGAAVVIGDEKMVQLYRDGKDLHTYTSEWLFPEIVVTDETRHDNRQNLKNLAKLQAFIDLDIENRNKRILDFLYKKQVEANRQISKTANFHFMYGGGTAIFQQLLLKDAGMWLPEEEIKDIKKKWLSCWPDIQKWQKKGIADWRKGRYWETPLGRRYTAKRVTDQMNIQIQGFGAEVAKLGIIYSEKKMKTISDKIPLRGFNHDSYIYTCPNKPKIYKTAAKALGDSMQEAWTEASSFATIKDLPMPVKVYAGYNWGDIEEGKYIYKYEN